MTAKYGVCRAKPLRPCMPSADCRYEQYQCTLAWLICWIQRNHLRNVASGSQYTGVYTQAPCLSDLLEQIDQIKATIYAARHPPQGGVHCRIV